ncbi:MAG: mechanosensitive ion channel [Desulfovibrio sp.]|nr:mechanosensitive ion channel [Desulfovibrio sp.]
MRKYCFLFYCLCFFLLSIQICLAEDDHTSAKNLVQNNQVSIIDILTHVNATVEQIHKELVEKREQTQPWKEMWHESRKRVKRIEEQVKKQIVTFKSQQDLIHLLSQHEKSFSQLLPSINAFKRWAAPTEAINNELAIKLAEINRDFNSLYQTHEQTKTLLGMVKNLSSYSLNFASDDKELDAYKKDLEKIVDSLTKEYYRQEKFLFPIENLKQEITDLQAGISKELPELWKRHYLQPPLTWLDASVWKYLPHQFRIVVKGIEMRKSLELPSKSNEWQKIGIRGLISLIFFSALLIFISRQKWVGMDKPVIKHMITRSLPVFFLGLCLLTCSYSNISSNYRFFLSLGNIFIIIGQIMLAWDLRLMQMPELKLSPSPLFRLVPLTIIAYILLYLPLLPSVLLVLWLFFIIMVLLWRRFWPELEIGTLLLEKYIRQVDGVVLWICLLLTLLGLPILSIIFYLICVSISLALELCLGGIDRIYYLNDNQPQDGIKAFLANLLVALAAPIIMLIAVFSVLLWVATLPGGMILLKEYLFTGINIGSTEFNIVHIIIIISAFFLAKAIASNGSRYVAQLISHQKNKVDTTLITPLQTAFTYLTWIFFTLFVLRLLEIDLKNAAMVLTGLSVGIGMGLQSIVHNFFAGLLLIFGRMLQVGDIIEVGKITGRVVKISVRDTLVRTFDNAYIFVPNSEFISGHLTNWSKNNASVRCNVVVGVAYGSDTTMVTQTMKNCVNKIPQILRYPEPSVLFQGFGDSTLDFAVYFWVNSFDDKLKGCSELRMEIERQFKEKKIEIAFPQVDVHIKKQEQIKRTHHRKRIFVRTNSLKNRNNELSKADFSD